MGDIAEAARAGGRSEKETDVNEFIITTEARPGRFHSSVGLMRVFLRGGTVRYDCENPSTSWPISQNHRRTHDGSRQLAYE